MKQEVVQNIKDLIDEKIRGVHKVLPAKIVEFDPSTGLATVSPTALFTKPDGTTLDYPHVSGVPLVFPQCEGQNITIAFPVHQGDGCLLLVADQSLDYWMFDRITDSTLTHDLTNAIAIVGLFQTASETMARACEENAVVVAAGEVSLAVSHEKVTILGDVYIKGDLELDGNSTTTGNASTKGNSSVEGNSSTNGTLSVKGATSMYSSLSVKGSTSLSSNLSVSGKSTLSDLAVSGTSTHQNLVVNQDLSVKGDMTIAGSFDVPGNLDVGGDVSIGGDLDLSGDCSACEGGD